MTSPWIYKINAIVDVEKTSFSKSYGFQQNYICTCTYNIKIIRCLLHFLKAAYTY